MATKKKIIKKAAKPAKKTVKPAAKKPLPKKVAKPLKKVAAKKPVKAKPVTKKVVKKPVAKVVKKAIKNKVAAKKPVVKAIAKKSIKKSIPVAKKKVIAKKPIVKALVKKAVKKQATVKKVVSKKPISKPAVKKTAGIKKSLPVKSAAKKGVAKTAIYDKPTKSLPIKTTPVAVHKKGVQNEMVTAVRKTPIIIPKTSVTTSVKYTPDFTKSVLDKQFKQPQSGLMIRYSDAELAEFKNLITKKLQAAREDLAYSQRLITRKDEMGGDEENRAMTMEDGSMSMEREQLSQMASRQMQFIDHLEKALMRIENKTYGVCRVTGKLIDKARLQAVPHATLSMEAKMSGAKND